MIKIKRLFTKLKAVNKLYKKKKIKREKKNYICIQQSNWGNTSLHVIYTATHTYMYIYIYTLDKLIIKT